MCLLGNRLLSVSVVGSLCQPGYEHTCSGEKEDVDESKKKKRMGKKTHPEYAVHNLPQIKRGKGIEGKIHVKLRGKMTEITKKHLKQQNG